MESHNLELIIYNIKKIILPLISACYKAAASVFCLSNVLQMQPPKDLFDTEVTLT